jgi:uncharacterized protein with PQ loop repeat
VSFEYVALCGWVGTFFSVGLNVPQVWRTCVRGRTSGLSPVRFWIAVINASIWLLYGVYGGGLVQVVNNGANLVLCTTVLAFLLPVTPRREQRIGTWVVTSLAVLALTVVVGEIGGLGAVGILATIPSVAMAVPQLVRLLRRPTESTAGVSVLSCWFALIGKLNWLVYGVARHEWPVIVGSAPVAAILAWTLVLLARSDRNEASTAAPVGNSVTA